MKGIALAPRITWNHRASLNLELALMLMLLVLVVVASLTWMGGGISNVFNGVNSHFSIGSWDGPSVPSQNPVEDPPSSGIYPIGLITGGTPPYRIVKIDDPSGTNPVDVPGGETGPGPIYTVQPTNPGDNYYTVIDNGGKKLQNPIHINVPTPECMADGCHDVADSWFGPGYPSTSAPTHDASGYPVSGTWPAPTTYLYTGNAHALMPAATQSANCLLCHTNHAVNGNDYLKSPFRPTSAATLADDQTSGTYAASCFACHDGSSAVNIKTFATASSPSAGHRIITSGGTLPAGAPLGCSDCHNPHGSKRGNASMLSDERGGSLETSSASGVRQFCFTCHTTSDTVAGWDSNEASYVPVGGETVEGIRRDSGALNLSDTFGHNETDGISCNSCHGNDYSAGGFNVHNPNSTP